MFSNKSATRSPIQATFSQFPSAAGRNPQTSFHTADIRAYRRIEMYLLFKQLVQRTGGSPIKVPETRTYYNEQPAPDAVFQT
jgi:hypothetical protein